MIYKNKNTEMLKKRLANGKPLSADKIVKNNKMEKPKSILRSANNRMGRIINKKGALEKAEDKLADKQNGNEPTKLDNPSNVKVQDELYKKMKLKDLQKLALTDQNAKKFMLINKLGV